MKNTNIQWADSTINPVMGCNGCELWPSPAKIQTNLAQALAAAGAPAPDIRAVVAEVVGGRATSEIYSARLQVAQELAGHFNLGKAAQVSLVDVIRLASKCYAGHLGTFRAGHKGYAESFEQPKLFPGRMAMAALWSPPSALERSDKPWLLDAPRMIFVSDMGDALSSEVPFPYLKTEVIDVVASEAGQRHLWLWLSKRPARMAKFGHWLLAQGLSWPDNLVAMTTVTSQATAGRIAELLKVPARFRGLSCEPVFGELNLNLAGIDWVIVGGGSDVLAEPFQVEWALGLREQCRKAGADFFLKQLGKNPTYQGKPVVLPDQHGGDWDAWPVTGWRTRQIPAQFRIKSRLKLAA